MRAHNPATFRTLLVLAAVLMATIPRVAAGAEAPSTDPPDVGETYQEYIDTAWKEAGDFHNPTSTCAGLKGRIMGTGDTQAFLALFACNVDIPVRYFETYLDRVEAGEKTCRNFMMAFITGLSAMTMSTDSLLQMADALNTTGDAESSVEGALESVAEEAMTEEGLKDPKRLIKDRMSERTQAVCPDIASVILR